MKLLIILLLLASCGKQESVSVVNGKDGKDGANGHSVVSLYAEAQECLAGGTRLDFFLDNDDSLDASEGDSYQNSILACNGAAGLDGIAGADGEDGEDGDDGAVGAIGPIGLTGPAGAIGPIGPQGVAGPTGPQGPASATECSLSYEPNQGQNGKKWRITCGTQSIVVTAQ